MDLQRLQQQLASIPTAATQWPPAHWQPTQCGDIPIRINRDGQWFYQNSAIQRPELVTLFSSVLHRQGTDYYLTTPVESVRIQVDDAPFVLIDWQWLPSALGPVLQVKDNLARSYLIGAEYPVKLQTEPMSGELLPYLQLARGLTAKFSRPCYYQLVAQLTPLLINGQACYALESGGYPVVFATADAEV